MKGSSRKRTPQGKREIGSFDFRNAPGFLIRRAHQHSIATYARRTAEFGVTPVQFAILNTICAEPGLDQISIAQSVAFDAATIGSVLGRLEKRELITRCSDPNDQRRKLITITAKGKRLLVEMFDAVTQVQEEMLSDLTDSERDQLIFLLKKLHAQ